MFTPSSALPLLFHEVNALANQLRKIEGVPQADLSSGEYNTLRILNDHGGMTVPNIARARLTSRQNTQVTINRLIANGWVESVPNPAHRRSPLLRITSAGASMLSVPLAKEGSVRARVVTVFSEDQLREAAGRLRELRQLLAGEETAATERAKGSEPARREPESPPAARSYPAPIEDEIPVNLL